MTDKKEIVDNDEFIIIEEELQGENVKVPEDSKEVEDTPIKSKEQDTNNEEDEEDESLEGKSESEKKEIHGRNWAKKQARKRHQERMRNADKMEVERLKVETEDLKQRLQIQEEFSRRSVLSDADRRIQEAQKKIDDADTVMANAITQKNGDDYRFAQKFKEQAIKEAQDAYYLKQQQEQTVRKQDPPPDQRIINFGREFLAKHPWYNANSQDEDSVILTAVDGGVQRDGYDPRTKEYWDELSKRAAKKLPDRFMDNEDKESSPRKPVGGPPTSNSREQGTTGKREFHVSAARKEAMIKMGIWDDPVERQKMIKNYYEYDKQHKQS